MNRFKRPVYETSANSVEQDHNAASDHVLHFFSYRMYFLKFELNLNLLTNNL